MKLVAPVVAATLAVTPALVVPAPAAAAKTRTLTGQVTAAPYVVKRTVFVPVLLDQRSAKRAKLRAPVGVLMLRKASTVKVKGQRARVAPDLLRVGDRLRSRARVNKRARRAFYWRVAPKRFSLTKRSKALSSVELAALMEGVGTDLRRLDAALTALATYVRSSFTSVGGNLSALRTDLTALGTALAALEKRLGELEGGMPALEARLQEQIDSLGTSLAALGTQVTDIPAQIAALQATLTGLQGQLGGLEGDLGGLEGDLGDLQSDLQALQGAVTQLGTDLTALDATVDILCGPTSLLDALC